MITTACISQICGVLWSLNSSRAWIRAQSLAFIPAIVSAQLLAAYFLDLRVFHNVLIFGLVTVMAPLPVYFVDAFIGFRQIRTNPTTAAV